MKALFKISSLIILISLITLSACKKDETYENSDAWVASVQEKIPVIRTEQLKVKIDSMEMFYLIDVREAIEHYHGFIPGSINIPGGSLPFKMGNDTFWEDEFLYKPEKSDLIIVYCKKGKRSVLAAEALQKLGYKNIFFLDGGFKKWELSYPNEYETKLDMLNHGGEEKGETGGC